MSGRHEQAPRRTAVRWLAAPVALIVAASVFLIGSPAGSAASTVNAQLSLSGVATKTSVLGGTTVGVHPGDSVNFKASALPTAGLENIPALGSLLNGLLGTLTKGAFQVKVKFASSVPSVGGKTVTLGGPSSGKCAGKSQQTVRFPNKGTFSFTWTVSNVVTGLLGSCKANALGSTELNQLEKAGVELNAKNQYVGKIVVADNPPKGGISIQLPSVEVSPKVGPIKLPKVSIPGASLPTVGVPDLPTGKKTDKPSGGSKTTAGTPKYNYTPPGLTVPDRVVPNGAGGGAGLPGGSNGGYYGGLLPNSNSQIDNTANLPALNVGSDSSSTGKDATNAKGGKGTVELAADAPKPSGQLPVVLAIIAVLALALVAGTYARLFLLRKQV